MSADLYLSVDLDSLGAHLRGHGEHPPSSPPASNPVLERALPRFLDLFDRLGIRATLFVVAEDAEPRGAEVRSALAAGHEIASHSLSHPVPFACLAAAALEEELAASRLLLERLLGVPVRGFRAPGLALSPLVLEAVRRAGYAYDSSLLPSPYLIASMLSLRAYRRAPLRDWLLPLGRYAFASRLPRRLPGGLWELPLSVSAFLRLPLYHTPRLILGSSAFGTLARRSLRAAEPYLHYFFHGIDLLAPDEVGPELHRHPGVRLGLAEKTRIAEEMLRRLLPGRRPRRLVDFVAERGVVA